MIGIGYRVVSARVTSASMTKSSPVNHETMNKFNISVVIVSSMCLS